jgi:hypothetical protein
LLATDALTSEAATANEVESTVTARGEMEKTTRDDGEWRRQSRMRETEKKQREEEVMDKDGRLLVVDGFV